MDGGEFSNQEFFRPGGKIGTMIANLRAEPTTEYIKDKNDSDQQPYYLFPWGIVHNGTIANDREIRTHKHPSRIDSTAIVESLLKKSLATPPLDNFVDSIQELKGSFAILGINMLTMDTIYLACNYRPVWYAETPLGIFFASAREYFPDGFNPRMVTPYSIMIFTRFSDQTEIDAISLYRPPSQKALVICSGGLDSTVAASWAIWKGLKTELIHFRYGSRAEGPEVQAIQKIAEHLKIPVTLFPLPIYRKEDSPLLNPDSKIAGGEAGAEFAYEWVPARNLVMLSVATAFAEARGIDNLIDRKSVV